jgi:hypothetical protein
MPKYEVKIEFIYSDVIEDIEAADEEEAERIAREQCEEQCERVHDINVVEIES